MASIIKIGKKWRAQVLINGKRITQTFEKRKGEGGAEEWATKNEADRDSGKTTGIYGASGVTVETAATKYEAEHALCNSYTSILRSIKSGLGAKMLDRLTDDDIVEYFKGRNLSPGSVGVEFSMMKVLFDTARVEWKYKVANVLPDAAIRLKRLKLIGSSRERTRRPTQKEIDKLCAHDFNSKIPMADIIMFAIHSAMRQAEITRIKWPTYNSSDKTVVITDRKHPKKKKGNHKTVPLLEESMAIIDRQPRPAKNAENQNIFPYNSATIGGYFTDACRDLGIEDLHFHDLRHEGTSRLFEMGYQIHEVAMFTGHENWTQLKRYTQLKAKDMRQLQPKADVIDIDGKRRIKELEAELAKLKQIEAA